MNVDNSKIKDFSLIGDSNVSNFHTLEVKFLNIPK